MKRFLFLGLALALAFAPGLIGCGGDDGGTKPTVSDYDQVVTLGDTYFTNYKTAGGLGVNVNASDVYTNLIDGNIANDPYIIDWRGAADFAAGHIAGAHNAALSGFEAAVSAIPAGKTVLNVCYTGQTASYATSLMNMLGYEAQNLKFGMCGWTADAAVTGSRWDNAVSDNLADWMSTQASTSSATYAPPSFSTGMKGAAEILRERCRTRAASGWKTIKASDLYADVQVNGKAGDYFIINYFPAANYDAGHVPGAVRFQPNQDLRSDKLLNTIPTDKKVVVYCYTGQTSAQVVAYLNVLGYDAYSLVYGVNGMCYSNGAVNPAKYQAPSTNYPVVTD